MQQSFDQILYVGPHHKNHRGGIGAVLDIYSKNIEPFQFVPTMSYRNKFAELFFYSGAIIKLFFTLLTNRKIRIVHIHGSNDGSVYRKWLVGFISKKIFSRKLVYHIHAGAYADQYAKGNKFYRSLCRFLV